MREYTQRRIFLPTLSLAVLLMAGMMIYLTDSTAGVGYDVKMQMTSDQNRPYSRFLTEVWNIPDALGVDDGEYLSWCVERDYGLALYNLDITYDATMYNSYDPSIPDGVDERFENHDFYRINYVLNHKGTTMGSDLIQEVIWYFCGYTITTTNTDILALISEATAYGGAYVPTETDEVIAYLLVPYRAYIPNSYTYERDNFQSLIIEVPFEPEDDDGDMGARTIGYWKNHEDVWDDWTPGTDSIFYGHDQDDMMKFFPKNNGNMETWKMVRVQLLAVELNFAIFGPGTDWDFDYGSSLYDIEDWMETAYDFLLDDPCYCDVDPSEWTFNGPGKKNSGYSDYKTDGSAIIDALDQFNNMGDEIFE
jgi:hypothetical protein